MPNGEQYRLGLSTRGTTRHDQRQVLTHHRTVLCAADISGSPYCLRRNATALRNLRDYTGVSTSRLEMLEERLKSDVIAEIEAFQGRVLVHTESADGEVVPVWETVDRNDISSLRDVMTEAAEQQTDVKLTFVRIPITSESSPDVSHLYFTVSGL